MIQVMRQDMGDAVRNMGAIMLAQRFTPALAPRASCMVLVKGAKANVADCFAWTVVRQSSG